MIVRSLLDTDLYKFTMMQVVLHHFPGAQVDDHEAILPGPRSLTALR